MRRHSAAVLVAAVAVLATACARSPAPANPLTNPGAAAGPSTGVDQTSAIHIEVLRRYLQTPAENSNLSRQVVFLLDHTDEAAADPMAHTGKATQPIPGPERDAITAALKDIAPVRFVATAQEAKTTPDSCSDVRDGGIIVVLGPLKASGAAYHVAVNGWAGCLGATWLTYVVESSGGGWKVTGTTGPMAVS